MAGVVIATHQAQRAAALLGATAMLREVTDAAIPPAEREDYDGIVAAVRRVLGDEAYAAAHHAGRRLTEDEAIAVVLTVANASGCIPPKP